MKIKLARLVVSVVFFVSLPSFTFAANGVKTFSGAVTKISGSQVFVKTTSAATFAVDVSHAILSRKNGTAMALSEIVLGDKLEVKGTLWPDNSVGAVSVRNMSLYTHTGTFSGKITYINPVSREFIIQSSKYGTQTIHTDAFTNFKRNTASSTLENLEFGVTASVRGLWDRNYAHVHAREVKQTVRLVNIEITGELVMKSSTGLTVVANGVMYGVDIEHAKLMSKNSKPLTAQDLTLSGKLKVTGKHLSERPQIFASQVRDLSITK